MSEELQKRLSDGKRMVDSLKQYKFSPKTKREMIDSFHFLEEIKK